MLEFNNLISESVQVAKIVHSLGAYFSSRGVVKESETLKFDDIDLNRLPFTPAKLPGFSTNTTTANFVREQTKFCRSWADKTEGEGKSESSSFLMFGSLK